MLLTRSRLCPGPKPGSSLHLHVLGTPPAFVLSQDQTLREELLNFTKSRQGPARRCGGHAPTELVGGPRACPWRDQTPASTRGSPKYTTGSGTQDGVGLGTAARRASRAKPATVYEPGHTSRSRVDREVRMLLSFQRPSHLSRKVAPSRRRAQHPEPGHWGGPPSIAPKQLPVSASLDVSSCDAGQQTGTNRRSRGVARAAPQQTT